MDILKQVIKAAQESLDAQKKKKLKGKDISGDSSCSYLILFVLR